MIFSFLALQQSKFFQIFIRCFYIFGVGEIAIFRKYKKKSNRLLTITPKKLYPTFIYSVHNFQIFIRCFYIFGVGEIAIFRKYKKKSNRLLTITPKKLYPTFIYSVHNFPFYNIQICSPIFKIF